MSQITIFDGQLKDKGYYCPCCQQYCKRYTRNFNSNMALVIAALHKRQVFSFVHIERWLQVEGFKRCGDFSYLTHFGLLEKAEGKRDDGSSRNGFYKLTKRGIMFAEGEITVLSKFKIFNNKFEGFEGKEITIKDALGIKFNYDELMGN